MKVCSNKTPIFWILISLTALLYSINFSVNDIWTENESFYAESVREMVAKGNYLDITYNYLPRYNKPPLTYWLEALSTGLFGMNAFAIRLPIVILAFWTLLLVWSIGRMLYDEKTALLAFAMQAVSIQYFGCKQYASPEIPLSFFFTLCLYFFLKGHLYGNTRHYYFAAVSLGLSVLTKGYPYVIVIGGIIILYLLIDSDFRWRGFREKALKLKPFAFIGIVFLIGLSWIALMYVTHGNNFITVLNQETFERALIKRSNGITDLFYYPAVLMWGFFPYSLFFVIACCHYIISMRRIKNVAYAFSWFLVMLIIFTSANGKLPTYFIQAYPALALISAHYITRFEPVGKSSAIVWNLLFLLPGIAGIILGSAIITIFNLPTYYHLITAAALLLIVIASLQQKHNSGHEPAQYDIRYLQPYFGTLSALLIFVIGVLPQLEEYRKVDSIGTVINHKLQIPSGIPLYLQDDMIHNLPFYAERKIIPKSNPSIVLLQKKPVLGLFQSKYIPDSVHSQVIWNGPLYKRKNDESDFFLFLESHLNAKKGDLSAFTDYSLIYIK